MKIAIIGYSGSGKSTLAAFLGKHHQIPVLHLDTVQFLPGWKERDRAEACGMVAEFMHQNPAWVIDGNYKTFCYEERMAEADQIIFMNFNRFACLIRALRRYFTYRHKTRASMAEGCNEKFDLPFFWWIFYESRTAPYRKRYRRVLNQYPEKSVVLKNKRQLTQFMEKTVTKM